MGVHCEINLFKPPDGAFLPGGTVSGIIKYAVDEETVFDKIDVSLKGNGTLNIRDQTRKRRQHIYIYRNSEDYVDIENIVHSSCSDKASPLAVGSYEFPFNFTLPQSIPASLTFLKRTPRYRIRCEINYYISIKFHRPGLFKFAKKFKKDITVVPAVKPRLPIEPTIFGEQKKLFQLFSRKESVVNITANLESCVINTGGKVNMNCEISNHTNLNLKGVETKLIETYTFTTKGHRKVKLSNDIENTDTMSGSINSGASHNSDIIINVPSSLGSLEYSNLVSRDYFVQITAKVPFPHTNAVLEVPLQIGDKSEMNLDNVDDPPPSYWEVMAEDQKKEGNKGKKDDDNDDGDDDDDDDDERKS